MFNKINQQIVTLFKVFVLLATSTIFLSGCRALSEKLDPDKNASSQNLPSVARDKPNLAAEPAPLKVDPDSEKLTEEARSAADPTPSPGATPNPETGGNSASRTVMFDGFGPVKIGMTVAQAEQSLGTKLVKGAGYGDACYFADPEGLPGVRFMVTNDKIARVDISGANYVTDRGAKVGDTDVAILENLYPGARVQPQRGEEKTKNIAVYSEDERYLIVFESDGERITAFRVGSVEAVLSPKGC